MENKLQEIILKDDVAQGGADPIILKEQENLPELLKQIKLMLNNMVE
jgi:hypothetical protein